MALTEEEIKFLETIIEKEDDSNEAATLLSTIREGIMDLENRGYCRIYNGMVMGIYSGEKVVTVTEAGRSVLSQMKEISA